MAIQQEKGNLGEHLAANYLVRKGYTLKATNYRAGRSEIDIICMQAKTLVFVEVKARSSSTFGHPESFVSEAKAAKIMEGAEQYMIDINWLGPIRFDIIAVELNTKPPKITHFEDAFY